MFNISLWDPSASYAVFDDFDDWSKWFQWKQFLGAQREFTITGKYARPRAVLWGKPCILLSNVMPLFSDMIWFDANVTTVNLREPLF